MMIITTMTMLRARSSKSFFVMFLCWLISVSGVSQSLPDSFPSDTVWADLYCSTDGSADCASVLNALIARTDVHVIIFRPGTYRLKSFHQFPYTVSKPYHLGIHRSDLQLLGQPGATLITSAMAGTLCIHSTPRDFDGRVHDIRIEGLTFQVDNESTSFQSYQEHCHTISLIGCQRVRICNNTFSNFWGDAICLDHYGDNPQTGERQRNEDVIISSNAIDGHQNCNRNGISVINGKRIQIDDNTLVRCAHSTMPGAIDIEPNYPCYSCQDIIIRRNHISQSSGANAAISLVCNKNGACVRKVLIEGNEIEDCNRAIEVAIETDEASADVTIRDNTSDERTEPYIFYGKGSARRWRFVDNHFGRKSQNKLGGAIRFISSRIK